MSKFYVTKENIKEVMMQVWDAVCLVVADKPVMLTIAKAKSKRSLDQNNLMWSLLGDVSKQALFYINGKAEKVTPEQAKIIMTAALDQEMKFCEINGAQVYMGQSTSQMSQKKLSELIEFIYAFGSQNSVIFTDNKYADMPEMIRGL